GGLLRALEDLSDGALAALPYAGPWSERALEGMFATLDGLERPVSVIANVATRELWGASASLGQLLAYLLDGRDVGPEHDWDVGHFVLLIGRVLGPAGALYGVADTYPSLGRGGVHLQPAARLARALERPGMAPGGLIVTSAAADARAVRARASELGLREEAWDNGTTPPGAHA
ncbi:MAG TPA: hypothetical protein VNZ05_00985, partial [Solirubrobacteraceae bacterium]|nr:hypothetical protein [Solirubrobacteraceae bacterium]